MLKLHIKQSMDNPGEIIGLSLLSNVVRAEKQKDGYLVAVEFMHLPKRTEELLSMYLYTEYII